jgi:uncharacterized protein
MSASRASAAVAPTKLDLPPFSPRFPWWGGHLQTVASIFVGQPATVAPHVSDRVALALDDGSGDRMLAMLDRPRHPRPGKPFVVLIHGMPGSEDSSYMVRMSRYLLDAGHQVLRLNLRGAGPSRAVCGGQYSAAASGDLRLALAAMPAEWHRNGLIAVGYSLGGAILLKYLGEQGRHTPLLAAATVSAPIDLLGTSRQLMGNPLYHAWVFRRMKQEALGRGARLTPAERSGIEASLTLRAFDDRFVAPRNGFRSAEEYYARCSALNFLPGIAVPTLLLTALDDPWVPGSTYRGNDLRANRLLTPVLSRHGGHVGFHARDAWQPWCDLVVARFIAAPSESGRLR